MRWRMEGNDDGHPLMVVFSTAVDFIRTVPFLQHDPDRPEDVLSDSEDHSATTVHDMPVCRGRGRRKRKRPSRKM